MDLELGAQFASVVSGVHRMESQKRLGASGGEVTVNQ